MERKSSSYNNSNIHSLRSSGDNSNINNAIANSGVRAVMVCTAADVEGHWSQSDGRFYIVCHPYPIITTCCDVVCHNR
jgi:hypothetical protein